MMPAASPVSVWTFPTVYTVPEGHNNARLEPYHQPCYRAHSGKLARGADEVDESCNVYGGAKVCETSCAGARIFTLFNWSFVVSLPSIWHQLILCRLYPANLAVRLSSF